MMPREGSADKGYFIFFPLAYGASLRMMSGPVPSGINGSGGEMADTYV